MYSRAVGIPSDNLLYSSDLREHCMIEIVLLIACFVLLAKRKPTKRRFNLRGVQSSPQLALGGLLANIAIVGACYGNADGAYRIMSHTATWSIANHTAGQGPIVVGFAHGDYTVTEIKESLESAGSISIGDKIANERTNRLIRRVGTFDGASTEETLNDGRAIKVRLNWAIPIGTNLNLFAYNDGGDLTTGTILHVNGKGWVKDY